MGRNGYVKVFLILGLIISFISNGIENNFYFKAKLPLHFFYLKPAIPDSLKNFINVYWKMKKIKIIKNDELRKMVFQEMSQKGAEWIQSDKIAGISKDASKQAQLEALYQPVANVFILKFL